jgi:hypothetical protein
MQQCLLPAGVVQLLRWLLETGQDSPTPKMLASEGCTPSLLHCVVQITALLALSPSFSAGHNPVKFTGCARGTPQKCLAYWC